jgi:carbon storage regulator
VDLGQTSNGGEMLVLTRKTNQSIMIGDDVEVSVLAVSRDKIRLGITAPRDVPVFRKEVYLSIKGEEASASEDEEDEDRSARREVDAALDGLTSNNE